VIVQDWVQAASMIEDAATVVNTTSLGMTGKPDLHLPMEAINPRALVTDLVYTPLKTQFLIEAEHRGCTVVDGLGMLLHQAAPGFERWFGHRPEVDAATRAAVLGT
jgi:shikimate dehydrogenase